MFSLSDNLTKVFVLLWPLAEGVNIRVHKFMNEEIIEEPMTLSQMIDEVFDPFSSVEREIEARASLEMFENNLRFAD